MSTTTQVNSEEFIAEFAPILEQGEDILYIAFSSGLSGTCQSAFVAKQELEERFPGRRVEVFDSLCASMGEGLLVHYAATMKKSGGRVSTATAFLGTMLGIKPVLHVDNEGHLIPVSKVRGRKQSLDALVKKMEESAIEPAGQTVFISHGDCLEDAEYVAEQVKAKLGVKKISINFIGPVIGAHSGPGTVALFFLGKVR